MELELTALERDEHVAEWIKLAEKPAQLAPVSKGGRGNEGGVRAAARHLGIDRDDARRATKVAGLPDEAKRGVWRAAVEPSRRCGPERRDDWRLAAALLKIAERSGRKPG